jgi:hypothetical protein
MSARKTKSSEQCSNDIYADVNYEKQREENLKRTSALYDGIFSEYSTLYSDYIASQRDLINSPNNPDIQNRSDAARVQKKPSIIKLNKKLVDIETELLNNNKLTYSSIAEQKKELDVQVKKIQAIDDKIDKLEKNIRIMEDKSDTGKYAIKDIQSKYKKLKFWYYLLITLSILLFIIYVGLSIYTMKSD